VILLPYDTAGHPFTVFVVDVLGWLGLGFLIALCVALAVKHRRRAHVAARTERTDSGALHLGPSAIAGEIDTGDNAQPIVIEIEQAGTETRNKHGWTHTWTEVSRRATAAPFHVRREGGELVRVDADDQVILIDLLDEPVPLQHASRLRKGTVNRGDRVHVLGEMTRGPDDRGDSGGYRKAAEGWILRAPSGGRLLVSTSPLAWAHRQASRRWIIAALAYLGMLLAMQLTFLKVNVLATTGRVVPATITNQYTWEVWVQPRHGPGHYVTHYGVGAEGDDGRLLKSEISSGDYVVVSKGMRVPFLVGGGMTQVGDQACANLGVAIVALLLLLMVVWLPAGIAYASRPWWERKLVEHGQGRLPE
jgi:hypothetical protein